MASTTPKSASTPKRTRVPTKPSKPSKPAPSSTVPQETPTTLTKVVSGTTEAASKALVEREAQDNALKTYKPFDGNLTSIDKQILEMARANASYREIGKRLRMKPEQVALRLNDIIESREKSDRLAFSLYLEDLYKLKDSLSAQVNGLMDSKDVANFIRLLEQLGKAIKDLAVIRQRSDSTVSDTQARFMVNVIVQAFEYAKNALAEEFPDVPFDVVESVFKEGLVVATQSTDGE